MMEVVVTIAGAVYLTDKLFALVDWIEKGKPFPVRLAAERRRTCNTNHHEGAGKPIIAGPLHESKEEL